MTDTLFILTIVFVAYVVYTMVDEQKATIKSITPETKPKEKVTVEIVAEPPPSVEIEPTPVNDAPLTSEIKISKASKKTSAAPQPPTVKHQVRNPKTGEITSTSSNYRFTKRWLKEALVSEKLLEKIYKNDELNEETEAKIKAALAKIEKMKKYRV